MHPLTLIKSLPEKRPMFFEIRSSTWFIIATVSTAIFTDIFLYAVIVPVFPFSLVERVGVHPENVQHWLSILLSVYGAALLVAAPLAGYISDRVTYRRTPLLAGMVVIAGATVMLCLAKSLPLLIVGRVLQGGAAGVVWVVGLALLADTVGGKNAGQAMGYVGTAYSMAALLAPLLGGIVYDKAGYYQVFAMAFGMCALDLTLRLLLIEKKAARKWLSQPEEIESSGTCVIADKPQTVYQSTGDPHPGSIGNSVVEEDVATAEGIAKIPSRKKLLPIVILLKSRRLQAAFWASTIDAMILTGFDTTLPLFVSETFHWNSLGAGLVFLAPLSPCFIQPVWGTLIDRYGPRWPAVFGLVCTIPPWILLRLITHDSMSQKILFCFLLFLVGLGASITLAAVMGEFTYICAEKERRVPGSMGRGGAYAQSYGLFNVSWAVGSLVGAYWAGGIRQSAGWATMTWTFALLSAVATVPVVFFTGGWIGNSLEMQWWKKRETKRREKLQQQTPQPAARHIASEDVINNQQQREVDEAAGHRSQTQSEPSRPDMYTAGKTLTG